MAKKAVEQTGLIPRSIIRTFDRFKKQLFSETENLIIQEFRISRYQFLVSIKCLFNLIFIPLVSNFLLKNFLLIPLTETFWNNKQSEIFLNSYQQQQAFHELKKFQEKLYFDYLINNQINFPFQINKNSKNCYSFNQSFTNHFVKLSDNLIKKKNNLIIKINCHDYINTSLKQNLNKASIKKKKQIFLQICKAPKFTIQNKSSEAEKFCTKFRLFCKAPFMQRFSKASIEKEIFPQLCKTPLQNFLLISQQNFPTKQKKIKNFSTNFQRSFNKKREINFLTDFHTTCINSKYNFYFKNTNYVFLNSNKHISEDEIKNLIKNKIVELAIYYNHQSILAVTNLISDFITFLIFSLVIMYMKPQISILKSFLTESIYSLNDTKKSFLLILGTDLLVGFHSPRGWEICLELLLRHFGFPQDKDFVFLFVASFPVILDTVFKYWIFRYLNKISPSTVATYHNMIE